MLSIASIHLKIKNVLSSKTALAWLAKMAGTGKRFAKEYRKMDRRDWILRNIMIPSFCHRWQRRNPE